MSGRVSIDDSARFVSVIHFSRREYAISDLSIMRGARKVREREREQPKELSCIFAIRNDPRFISFFGGTARIMRRHARACLFIFCFARKSNLTCLLFVLLFFFTVPHAYSILFLIVVRARPRVTRMYSTSYAASSPRAPIVPARKVHDN